METNFNFNLDRKQIQEYTGDISQMALVQESRLLGGRQDGVRIAHFRNGSGLEFTVVPDRGMDIASVRYKGHQISFLSGTGITAPLYYDSSGAEWLRTFFAGALTTCGITYFGPPQMDNGKNLGLHGRISNTPAEDVAVTQEWTGSEYQLLIKGLLREVSAFGENLRLQRTIETHLGQKGFRITDRIQNKGFSVQPMMLLYHFNFGFPLLNPNSRIVGPIRKTAAGNSKAAESGELDSFAAFPGPQDSYPERLFFHTLGADGRGRTFIAIISENGPDGGPLGVVLRFDVDLLPHLIEWKLMERQNYVVGLEPCTCLPLGRQVLREQDKLPLIQPHEEKVIVVDFEIIDSVEGLLALEDEALSLKNIDNN